LYRRTLADYRSNRSDLPLGDDMLPQPMDVCWLPCLDMTLPKHGNMKGFRVPKCDVTRLSQKWHAMRLADRPRSKRAQLQRFGA
jgi:hypothetical protein